VDILATKSNLFNEAFKKTTTASKGKDVTIASKKGKSGITIKSSGSISATSGIYAQHKIDRQSGTIIENSLNSVENTVTKELNCSDFIINKHKLNTQLLEFTNLMSNMNTVMGNMTMDSTILVKAWEPTLEQYVLIRRPARFAMFSNILDAYVIDPRLDILTDFVEDILDYKRNIKDLSDVKDNGK